MAAIGHNGGPALCEALTLAEAQELPQVSLRPSYVQRYSGPGAPLRAIVGLGGYGAIGRWVLLACGHWRESRGHGADGLAAYLNNGKAYPKSARCGCCRLGYLPNAKDVEQVARLAAEA